MTSWCLLYLTLKQQNKIPGALSEPAALQVALCHTLYLEVSLVSPFYSWNQMQEKLNKSIAEGTQVLCQDSSALSSTSCLFSSTLGNLPRRWAHALIRQWYFFPTPLPPVFMNRNSAACPQRKNTVILQSVDACILTFGLKQIEWLLEFTGTSLHWWFRGNMVIFLEKMKIGTCKVHQGNSSKAPGPLFVMCFSWWLAKQGAVYH